MHIFNPATKAESVKVNENFQNLSTGEDDVDNNRLALLRAELFADFVDTGLSWSIVSGLNGAMTAGVVYIIDTTPLMNRLVVGAITSRTFTASKDTYVDVDYAGAITYNEVANGATAPALASNSVRLAKVVTSGAAITSITQNGADNRSTPNVIYPQNPLVASWRVPCGMFYKNADAVQAGNVWRTFNLDSANYNNGFYFAEDRLYVPYTGIYEFVLHISITDSNPLTSAMHVGLTVDGTGDPTIFFGTKENGSSNPYHFYGIWQIQLNAGQSVTPKYYVANANNHRLDGGNPMSGLDHISAFHAKLVSRY